MYHWQKSNRLSFFIVNGTFDINFFFVLRIIWLYPSVNTMLIRLWLDCLSRNKNITFHPFDKLGLSQVRWSTPHWLFCYWQVHLLPAIARHDIISVLYVSPDSKIHGANMGPTWVLPAPGGPHVGHINLAIWVVMQYGCLGWSAPFHGECLIYAS